MIELRNLSKSFTTADGTVEALRDVSLTINDGDIYGIIGMSGAGKSTLVRCINMLERPSSGSVLIDGRDMSTLNPSELRETRRSISMIFQGFNLLMQRNCLGNVCFPLELAGKTRAEAQKRAYEMLGIVGLRDKAKAYPAQLSGGQQQRVAIARALATNPKVLLCDEATSALDPNTTHSILELIREINRTMNITAVVITHQMSVVEEVCNRVAILENGSVAEEGEVAEIFASPKSEAARLLMYRDAPDASPAGYAPSQRLRVIFNGAVATEAPLIAKMAVETGIMASILFASTKSIGEKAYGSMLLGICGGRDELATAVEYLSRTEDIIIQEVTDNAE